MNKKKKKKTDILSEHERLARNQREEGYLGQKGQRGQPFYYDEVKERISLMLTPTAKKKLAKGAEAKGFSRSEFVENWLRSLEL
ncbi:MAG TPA: hypothetical protein V6D26_08535 [Stenomitos sp.]